MTMTDAFYEQVYRGAFGEDAPPLEGTVARLFSMAMRLYAVCAILDGWAGQRELMLDTSQACQPELARVAALIEENRRLKDRVAVYENATEQGTGGRLTTWCETISDNC